MPSQGKIAVMVASDHPIMRDGLRLRIRQEADMWVVCEASDLPQILREFRLCSPDVVLIDLHVPRDATPRAIEGIRAIAPRTPLVVLVDSPSQLGRSLRAGHGVVVEVSKILVSQQIIPAIRHATQRV
jgi:two-component system, NarL family, response regulator YdfI